MQSVGCELWYFPTLCNCQGFISSTKEFSPGLNWADFYVPQIFLSFRMVTNVTVSHSWKVNIHVTFPITTTNILRGDSLLIQGKFWNPPIIKFKSTVWVSIFGMCSTIWNGKHWEWATRGKNGWGKNVDGELDKGIVKIQVNNIWPLFFKEHLKLVIRE